MALETFPMDGVVDATVGAPDGTRTGTSAICIYSDTDKVVVRLLLARWHPFDLFSPFLIKLA